MNFPRKEKVHSVVLAVLHFTSFTFTSPSESVPTGDAKEVEQVEGLGRVLVAASTTRPNEVSVSDCVVLCFLFEKTAQKMLKFLASESNSFSYGHKILRTTRSDRPDPVSADIRWVWRIRINGTKIDTTRGKRHYFHSSSRLSWSGVAQEFSVMGRKFAGRGSEHFLGRIPDKCLRNVSPLTLPRIVINFLVRPILFVKKKS